MYFMRKLSGRVFYILAIPQFILAVVILISHTIIAGFLNSRFDIPPSATFLSSMIVIVIALGFVMNGLIIMSFGVIVINTTDTLAATIRNTKSNNKRQDEIADAIDYSNEILECINENLVTLISSNEEEAKEVFVNVE